jgi:hypothetical protein
MNLLLSTLSCEGRDRRVQMFYTPNQGFHMNQPAYLDKNLPICERVQDLLSRLTLDEKVAMMNHPAQGAPRACGCAQSTSLSLLILRLDIIAA